MTTRSAYEHRLVVVSSSGDRQVLTSLPRGRDHGHRLRCGTCDGVLAYDRAPMPVPAPVMRCGSCRSLNDLTRPVPVQP